MPGGRVSAGVGLGILALAAGALGVTAAIFGDMRVAFGWGVAAAALFMVLAVVGAAVAPEGSMAVPAFLLFGCVGVMATMLADVSSWLGDILRAANGETVTYVWHGQTFTPTATEILFGSSSILGFVGAGAFFFLAGLVSLAGTVSAMPRRRPTSV